MRRQTRRTGHPPGSGILVEWVKRRPPGSAPGTTARSEEPLVEHPKSDGGG
ncbi:hypothetical protein FRUB_09445 [Fimbriiglobus ruber]|uniref:Uncharacterized protein n=1 Tax=Fimbriiglobus ruber TaxID=1908690 RepID=A0A225D6K9_9BACT|nr:hypothetical protein FRUB_09445 [Fimbriiglobus ruber]